MSAAGTSLDGHTLDEDSIGGRDPGGGDGRSGEGCEDDSLQIHLQYPKPAAVSFPYEQREKNEKYLMSEKWGREREKLNRRTILI